MKDLILDFQYYENIKRELKIYVSKMKRRNLRIAKIKVKKRIKLKMKTIKKITKKYNGGKFCELSSLSYKELLLKDSLLLKILSHKEVIELLSRLSMLNCIAVEHKGIIYLSKVKQNYFLAIEQIRLLGK